MYEEIFPVSHLERFIAGEEPPISHLEKTIAKYGTGGSGGSGGSGTNNYNALLNKPSINGVTLTINKTLADLKLLYEEEITTASNSWSIQHNLNTEWYKLFINIIDSDNDIIYGDIDVANSTKNLLIMKFDTPITGKITIRK